MALSAEAGIGIEWVFVGLATAFLLLRVWVRVFLQAAYNLSDAFAIISFLLFVAVVGCDTANWKIGLWSSDEHFGAEGPGIEDALGKVPDEGTLVSVFKLFYIAGPLFYVCMWTIKFSLLLFYYQLIPKSMRIYRRCTHFVTLFVAISFIIMLYYNFFYCLPISRNWSLDPDFVCYNWPSHKPYFTTLALHYATDICILFLPFPLLRSLVMSKKDKIGVGVMFALGVFTIVSVTARTVMIGVNFSIPELGAWSAIEMGTGIMVICCPSLKWLYRSNQVRKMIMSTEEGIRAAESGVVERSFGWGRRGRADSKLTIDENITRIDTRNSSLSK